MYAGKFGSKSLFFYFAEPFKSSDIKISKSSNGSSEKYFLNHFFERFEYSDMKGQIL